MEVVANNRFSPLNATPISDGVSTDREIKTG
jgi:hypothetical protein